MSIIMNFGTNKTPVEIVKEGAFGGSYFRDIYSGINGKWYRKSWKDFDDYSISPKIRQILLHWGYELTESDLL